MSGTVSSRPGPSDYLAVSRGSFRKGLRRRRFLVSMIVALLVGALIGGAVGALDPRGSLVSFILLGMVAMIV